MFAANANDWVIPVVEPSSYKSQAEYLKAFKAAVFKSPARGTRLVLSEMSIEIPVGWEAPPVHAPTLEERIGVRFPVGQDAEKVIRFGTEAFNTPIAVMLVKSKAGTINPTSFDAALSAASKSPTAEVSVRHWDGKSWRFNNRLVPGEGRLLAATTRVGTVAYRFLALVPESLPAAAVERVIGFGATIQIK